MKYCYLFTFLVLNSFLSAQMSERTAKVNVSEHNSGTYFHQQESLKTHYCATDLFRQRMAERRSELMMSEDEMDQHILEGYGNRDNELLYIPIVIHIIHNNGTENISDEQVLQGIQHLNDAFANTGDYYTPSGYDMGIRFCLAEQDPNGLPTTGITRDENALTEMYADGNNQDILLKNINRWDPLRYVNIWLVREIKSFSMGNGVAGYAYLPNLHGHDKDGIVNEARWFGSNTDNSKIHVHEMGHYLGLYHTFEGGCTNNNCQTDGDRVCDTPPDMSTAAVPCGQIANTCTTDENDTSINNPFRPVALGGLGDQPDLVQAYMDYGLQTCQNMFTEGQGARMRAAIENIRYSLLESQVCETSCGIGNISINGADNVTVLAGAVFELGCSYLSSVEVSFEWVFNGEVISTEQDLSHTFNNDDIGTHFLYLRFINAEEECALVDSIQITIRCNPPASFSYSPTLIEPGDEVVFDGYNVNATSYQWFLNDAPVGSNSSFTHTFSQGGVNHLYLVTGNGVCFDTSAAQYLGIGNCGSGANNHWIFGDGAGNHVDFSSGAPVVSAVPSIGENGLSTIEGVATISDRNGNLLFYSDGYKLFNRNHEQFFYGMGAGPSSAQGVLIVPQPGNETIYYVFTAENFGGMAGGGYYTGRGLSYLKVDMTMNNGLGGVTGTYLQLLNRCAERLSATLHCNGTDVWVVAHGHNNNLFYSYLITESGLQEPVVTAIGTSQASGNSIGGQSIGIHKFSPDGSKLFSSAPTLNFAELFDFDTSTGVLSNPYKFPVSPVVPNIYSAEFSPDGTKLYFGRNSQTAAIYRCDISSGIPQMINNSIQVIGNSSAPSYLGSFQLGPDGKIYIARLDNYLDVIHNPNGSASDCGLETAYLELPRNCRYGLTNILTPRLYDSPIITGPTNVCAGATNVKYKTSCGDNTWEYIGNNTMTILSNKEVSINFTTGGSDMLICHRANSCNGTGSDTLILNVGSLSVFLGNDTTVCAGTSLQLTPGPNYQNYFWSSGSTAHQINVTQTGNYWVQVTGVGGCTARDTIHVTQFQSTFDVPDVPVVYACGVGNNSSYHTLQAQQGDFTHIWNNIQSSTLEYSAYIPNNISYIPITYYSPLGCIDRDTIVVQKISTFPSVDLGPNHQICPGDVVVLTPETDYENPIFHWSNEHIGDTYTVYTSGTYMVRYQDSVCHNWHNDYITIGYYPQYNTTLPNIPIKICEGSSYTLDAGNGFSQYTWNDGTEERYLTATEPGLYWVEAVSQCRTLRDSVYVEFIDESLYSINFPDTIELCSNQVPYSLSPNTTGQLNNLLWSNGNLNHGNIIIYEPGTYWLQANYICGTVSDTTHIAIKQQPSSILPPNVNFCEGQTSYTLYGQENAINTWSTGVVADSIVVNQTGAYQLSSLGENGCTTTDDIHVTFSDLYIEPISNTTLCGIDTLIIPINTNTPYLHTNAPLLDDTTMIITQQGIYFVVAIESFCAKQISFSVTLSDTSDYEIELPQNMIVCGNELPVILEAENDLFTEYLWSNGATTASINVTEPGTYSVEAHYSCGTKTATTHIGIADTPTVVFANDTSSICNGAPLVLHADSQYDNLWSDESTGNTLIVTEPGLYWLQASNVGGCFGRDSIFVVTREVSLQTINDTGFCAGSAITVQAISNASTYSWSTGEMTSYAIISAPGTYSLSAGTADCMVEDSFLVTQWPTPLFSLGDDIVTNSPPVILAVSNSFASYSWNVPNETGNTLQVNESGTYILTVTNHFGCTYTDTIHVGISTSVDGTTMAGGYIDVPMVHSFSSGPLVAKYNQITVHEIILYDATGRVVNATNDFPTIWNGQAATGIYYYSIHYVDSFGIQFMKQGKVLMVP
jgi:hypothetical protein